MKFAPIHHLLCLLFGICGMLGICTLGCGGPRTSARILKGPSTSIATKMHHQILFRHGEDEHVFDGYMLLAKDGLIVKAFAGPGIDLFTVVHMGVAHKERLHLESLKGRMDIAKISEDIARIYAPGCGDSTPNGQSGEISCSIRNSLAIEKYDDQGRLISRTFPKAHGVGLNITYSKYKKHRGLEYAHLIRAEWGSRSLVMVIHLGRVEIIDNFDSKIFEATLDSL